MLALAHSVAMLFAARIVDGLSGGNISTARAYVADVTEPKDRARAYGLIGAAFGLGFILGPALSGVLVAASATPRRSGRPRALTLVATAMAWLWLPETVHRAHGGHRQSVPLSAGAAAAPAVRRDPRRSTSSTGSRSRRSRRRSRCSWRGGSASASRRPATSSRRSACSARSFRAASSGPVVKRLGDKPTFLARTGLRRRRPGRGGARAFGRDVRGWRSCRSRSASASAIRRCRVSSAWSPRGDEQGRVQGAASAVESLGRTIGPVWGNASLQQYGESMPYISAAAFLLLTFLLSVGFHVEKSRHPAPL